MPLKTHLRRLMPARQRASGEAKISSLSKAQYAFKKFSDNSKDRFKSFLNKTGNMWNRLSRKDIPHKPKIQTQTQIQQANEVVLQKPESQNLSVGGEFKYFAKLPVDLIPHILGQMDDASLVQFYLTGNSLIHFAKEEINRRGITEEAFNLGFNDVYTKLKEEKIDRSQAIHELTYIIKNFGIHTNNINTRKNIKNIQAQLGLIKEAAAQLKTGEHIPSINLHIFPRLEVEDCANALMQSILDTMQKKNITYSNLIVDKSFSVNADTLGFLFDGLKEPNTISLNGAKIGYREIYKAHKNILAALNKHAANKGVKLYLSDELIKDNPNISEYISYLLNNQNSYIDMSHSDLLYKNKHEIFQDLIKSNIQMPLNYLTECEKQGLPISRIGFTHEPLKGLVEFLQMAKDNNIELDENIDIDACIEKYSKMAQSTE